MYKKYIKRLLDIIFSIVFIIVLLPIMVITGLISKVTTGHIIFKQNRDGLNKKSFTMYKFSSIKPNMEYSSILNFLRSFGFDEIPQLVNILKGDMSFIGPRPFITGEILPDDYIDPIIYSVRPGVISLATAKGRRRLTHKKRLEYDFIYASNVSIKLDAYVIFKSIAVILKQNVKGDGDGQIK